jgi:hypothetical protein
VTLVWCGAAGIDSLTMICGRWLTVVENPLWFGLQEGKGEKKTRWIGWSSWRDKVVSCRGPGKVRRGEAHAGQVELGAVMVEDQRAHALCVPQDDDGDICLQERRGTG